MVAEALTRALGGSWDGRQGIARCPAHEDAAPSLSLGDGNGGALLLYCHAGCGFADVMAALRQRGLDGGRARENRPAAPERARQRARAEAAAQKRSAMAQRLWDAGQPVTGTPAEAYLRRRGITCALPESLRYIRACWHKSARRLPALVARVDGGDGMAVHRTYIRGDGHAKACVTPAKVMLGAVRGGAVRLGPPSQHLVVAEGIETALSLACGLLDRPATPWAALSAGGLRRLRLPPRPGELTVAADGDPVGQAAAHDLARRAHVAGWQVSLLPAPQGADWNDVLCGKAVTP